MKNIDSKSREDLTAANRAEDRDEHATLEAPVPESLTDNDGRRQRADAAIETIGALRRSIGHRRAQVHARRNERAGDLAHRTNQTLTVSTGAKRFRRDDYPTIRRFVCGTQRGGCC